MLLQTRKRKELFMLKYSKEETLAIGREIYDHYLTIAQATEKYGVNYYTARDYYRIYRDNLIFQQFNLQSRFKQRK